MSFFIKIINLFIIGILMAVIVYPVLHELAHSITCVLFGAEIIEVNLFPCPSVLCNVDGVSNIGVIAIGISGVVLPFVFAMIGKTNKFWIWYIKYVIKLISALAFIISAISTICFLTGRPLSNDDTTQLLLVWGNNKWICLIAFIGLSIIAVFELVKERPLEKCLKNFGLI